MLLFKITSTVKSFIVKNPFSYNWSWSTWPFDNGILIDDDSGLSDTSSACDLFSFSVSSKACFVVTMKDKF
jgi:hypothetical protein